MKANYRKAFNALKKIGAPVLETAETERDGNFGISGEFAGGDNYHYDGEKADAPDGRAWANYYSEDWKEVYSRFGVHNAINDILDIEKGDVYDMEMTGMIAMLNGKTADVLKSGPCSR